MPDPNEKPSSTPVPPLPNQQKEQKPPQPKPEPPRPPVDLDEESGTFALIDALLKNPWALWEHLRAGRLRAPLLLGLALIVNVILFGCVIGSFSGGVQWWAAPLKITAGLLVAGMICFPSLYIFICLSGADLRPGHLARGLIAALALVALILVGFAPIVWIFSQSTDSLGFMGTIFLFIWVVGCYFGLGFMKKLLRLEKVPRLGPYYVWAALFVVVTLQMSTALRPILGTADTILPTEKRFFLQHWGESLSSGWEYAEEETIWDERKAVAQNPRTAAPKIR